MSLQQYLDCGRVPRGLRIFTTPTFKNPNPRMLKDWTENSAKCTKGMLEILIKYSWSDREVLLKEIEELSKLRELDTANLDEFIRKMEKRLEKIEENIKIKKHKV